MAILSKIRDRSIALIAVIGLALFAFVLDPSQLSDFFSSSKVNVVGEVDGEAISRKEFSEKLDNYRARTGNRGTEMQAAKFVWDNIIREKIYTQQLDEAGITIGEEDVWSKVISVPAVANNPQFKNEIGLFDEDKFKLFLKEAQESEDQQMWLAWSDYINQLARDLKRDTYNNLLNAGLSASLKEGEFSYNEDNTKLFGDLVYIPYSSIPDSLVSISRKEVASYMDDNESEFKVDESRNIAYVKFDIEPTLEDENNIKNELTQFISDKKEYNAVSKRDEVVKGFSSTDDYKTFFSENQSDIPFLDKYRMLSALPVDLESQFKTSKKGDVLGPVKERNFYKLIKITDIKRRPDSVKSSHILIPFVGSQAAQPTTVKSEAQAKKSADSIYRLVRRNKKKFAEIADEINTDGSKGKGGDIGWVSHLSGTSSRFDEDFANFIFDEKKGKVSVVKTKFGFHIIRIDDQKNFQNAYKSIFFGRQIIASEKTENEVFQKAEQFALELSKNEDTFFNIARKNNLETKPAIGLKVLEDKVPGIPGNARQIVVWSFQKDTEINEVKRFDLDNSYVVATVTGITKEGLMSPASATNRIRPVLVNKKKAELINEKMNGSSLEDIAKNNNTTIRKVNGVSVSSPTLSGIGFSPNAVGAMFKAKENTLVNKVKGQRGVFAFVVTKKEKPTALPNYEAYRQRITEEQKNRTTKVFEALKKESDIEDNRAFYYGIDN